MPQSSLQPQHPEYVDREVIVLDKNGIWIADGSEITHEPTRRLFARSLVKDSEGYFLSIGRETKRIEVEDTAYFVERILEKNGGNNTLQLSDGSQERLDPETLRYTPGRLTCRIKRGSHGYPHEYEEAKFLRTPYHEILRDLEEVEGNYFLNFGGKKIQL